MAMKTNIQSLIELFQRSIIEITKLSGFDHELVEINDILLKTGAELELFLKKHIYLNSQNKKNFEDLISDLLQFNLKQNSIDALHTLRRKYNKAKHDPTDVSLIDEIIKTLNEANLALLELQQYHIGTSQQPVLKNYQRRLWFAAWDHYIGGDTEFSLFLPVSEEIDFPPTLDIIYLKMEKWDQIKAELKNIGSVEYGIGKLPKKYYDFWAQEGDFLNAGTFEGNYKSLINVLSKHERVVDILPDLKRQNDSYSMYASTVFAALDAAADAHTFQDTQTFACYIASISANNYAGKTDSVYIKKYSLDFAEFIIKCPDEVLSRLSGPYWVNEKKFNEELEQSLIFNKDLKVQITNDSRFLVGIL